MATSEESTSASAEAAPTESGSTRSRSRRSASVSTGPTAWSWIGVMLFGGLLGGGFVLVVWWAMSLGGSSTGASPQASAGHLGSSEPAAETPSPYGSPITARPVWPAAPDAAVIVPRAAAGGTRTQAARPAGGQASGAARYHGSVVVTVGTVPARVTRGLPFTITAQARAATPGGPPLTGHLRFTLDGVAVEESVDETGSARARLVPKADGPDSVEVSYVGDSHYDQPASGHSGRFTVAEVVPGEGLAPGPPILLPTISAPVGDQKS